MNHSHRVLLAITLGLLIPPVPARAQIANSVRTATTIDEGSSRQITDFVASQGKLIETKNNDQQKAAREALVEAAHAGASDPSAAYAAVYADRVNTEMLRILTTSKDVRARLNAAIVVARVAEFSRNTKLEKCALALLDSSQAEPFALWGMKAAKSILPELIKLNLHKPLLEAMLAAVKKYPDGPMTQEAYDALTPKNATNALVGVIADPLLELTRTRVNLYKTGLPEDPVADQTPLVFLTTTAWRAGLSKSHQLRTIQLICELLVLSAQHGDNPAHRQMREQIATMIQKIGQGLFVAANVMPPGPATSALRDAALKMSKDAESANAKLQDVVAPICPAMRKVPGFEAIEEPKPATSAPATSTAPARTAPVR